MELDTISEMSLDGQVALVTGGGTGIGAAIARRFAAEGASVAVMGRRERPLTTVADEVGGLAIAGDVTCEADVERAVHHTVERFGGLDVVVNNAGSGSAGWQTTLAVNLVGPALVIEAAVPHLAKRRGAVVNVASVAGLVAGSTGPEYAASKAGLVQLTRTLAVRLGPLGIRVNTLCPGWVRTELADRAMAETADRRGLGSTEAAYASASAHVPLRRVAEPDEIAAACLFLASREASFVTGAALVADGGSTVVDVTSVAAGF
jgi:NAD(P)-dependent dehydrogenase (short-subunit alcohol dehydrogenase family)